MTHWGRPASVGALAFALILAGCSDDSAPAQPTTTGAESATTTSAPAAATTATPAVAGVDHVPVAAAQAALDSAAKAVPNGRPFDLEVDTRRGSTEIEVRVASDGNEFAVRVDPEGLKVLSQNQSPRPSDDVAQVQAAQVDAGAALQTAADREPGAALSEMEIDTEAGVVVWAIELVRPDGSEVELDVDAQTGAIR